MHITCTPGALAKPLSRCASICNPRSPSPMAYNILLEAKKKGVLIYATDFERTLVERVTDVEVHEAGRVCVSGKTLSDIVNLMQNDVELEIQSSREDHQLHLRTPASRLNLSCYDETAYPDITPFASEQSFPVDAHTFEQMVRMTEWCVPEGKLLELAGVYMEARNGQLRMTSTDRQVMVHTQADAAVPESLDIGALVAAPTVERLAPVAGGVVRREKGSEEPPQVDVAMLENAFMVREPNAFFSGPVMATTFPPYERYIPGKSTLNRSVTCNRNELMAAIRQCKLFTSIEQWGIVFSVDDDQLVVRGASTEKGSAIHRVDAAVEGKWRNLRVAFNPDFFLTGLRLLPIEEVTVQFADASRRPSEVVDRALIQCDVGRVRFLYMIMSTSLPGE